MVSLLKAYGKFFMQISARILLLFQPEKNDLVAYAKVPLQRENPVDPMKSWLFVPTFDERVLWNEQV